MVCKDSLLAVESQLQDPLTFSAGQEMIGLNNLQEADIYLRAINRMYRANFNLRGET